MPSFYRFKIRLLRGIILIAGVWVLTQPTLAGLPKQAKSTAKSPKTENKVQSHLGAGQRKGRY